MSYRLSICRDDDALAVLPVGQVAVRAKLIFGFTVKWNDFPSSIFSDHPFGRQPAVGPVALEALLTAEAAIGLSYPCVRW